jgi:hypothetical protein
MAGEKAQKTAKIAGFARFGGTEEWRKKVKISENIQKINDLRDWVTS